LGSRIDSSIVCFVVWLLLLLRSRKVTRLLLRLSLSRCITFGPESEQFPPVLPGHKRGRELEFSRLQ